MINGDAWIRLIQVHDVLEKTPSMTDRLSEGHYTEMTSEHLLIVNRMVNLNTLIGPTTAPHFLMTSREIIQMFNCESKRTLENLFSTLKYKFLKIILTTQSENDTVTFLQHIAIETLSNGFVTKYEQLT